VTGRCSICGWEGEFKNSDQAREGMHCGNCASTSRHRAVMHVLGEVIGTAGLPVFSWPSRKDLVILESSARGPHPVMLADKFDYYGTEFNPEKIASAPRSYADFQSLHYADGTFDLVIASDVFEHIRDDHKAFREIYRVLKPGGSLILTVPYNHDQPATIQRVDTAGKTDVHLLEPEYHGGGGQTLAYRNYGRDLLSLIRGAGFSVARLDLEVPAEGITPQTVIVGAKADFVDFRRRDGSTLVRGAVGFLLPYRLYLLVKFSLKGIGRYLWEVRHR
jgi:SAM-dependent methyltransferase